MLSTYNLQEEDVCIFEIVVLNQYDRDIFKPFVEQVLSFTQQ